MKIADLAPTIFACVCGNIRVINSPLKKHIQGDQVMCAWIIPPVAGLIEPAVAPEFYIDGCGAIEVMNGIARFYLYAEQMPIETGAGVQPMKMIAVKVLRPVVSLPTTLGQIAQVMQMFASERAPGIQAVLPPAGPGFPHLVK